MLSLKADGPEGAAIRSRPDSGRRIFGRAIAALFGVAMLAGAVTAPSAGALMPDRAYELVSPPDKAGIKVGGEVLSPDGSQAIIGSGGAFAGTPSQDGLINSYLARRSSGGWQIRPLNLPAAVFATPGLRVDSSEDLSEHLSVAATYEEARSAGTSFYIRDADGTLRRGSPPIHNLTLPDSIAEFITYAGASTDFDSIVFTTPSRRPVLPTDTEEVSSLQNVYEVHGARSDAPVVRRVDVDDAGEVIGFRCGRTVGGAKSADNVVSDDGRTIFFSGRTPAPAGTCTTANRGPIRVFARVDGASTVEISKSECNRTPDPGAVPPVQACAPVASPAPAAADAQFLGSSSDGDVVLFSTSQQLADTDTDATDDLYEYRRDPGPGQGHLTQITAAPGQSMTPGSGARHVGVVRISDDGRRVYFVAQGVLSTDAGPSGESAADGANNLYVFERTTAAPNGRVRFVATLAAAGDAGLWGSTYAKPAQLSDERGQFLVFASVAPLKSDDTDTVSDVYRYDAVEQALVRISRGKAGYATDGNGPHPASIPARDGFRRAASGRVITTDGSDIVFQTTEALQQEDTNDFLDVYEWNDGDIELVTLGSSTVEIGGGPFAVPGSAPSEISADGSTIMFATADRLTGHDIDGAVDTYVARRGGGFPFEAPQVPPVCVGDGCQGTPPAPPSLAAIGSVSFVGDGNVSLVPESGAASIGVSRMKTVSRGVARLKVRVPSAGRILLSGRSVRRINKPVSTAGSYRLSVVLKRRARKALSKQKRLAVRARVVFRAQGGRSASRTVAVIFKQPKKKHAMTRGGQ